MARYSNTVRNQYEQMVAGASVYVYTFQGALAELEQDGGGALANPLTTDTYGGFYFNADDGIYTLTVHDGGKFIYQQYFVQVGTGPELPADIIAALIQPGGASLIGFIQSGTGAVATTLQAKAREPLSPLDFGCTGDGATDDTVNFNKALVAAITQGKPLDGLGLTYGLSATGNINPILPLTAGVTLYNAKFEILNPGTGYGTIIGSIDPTKDLSGLLIENVIFDQQMVGVTPVVSTGLLTLARVCVKAKRGNGMTVRGCTFDNVLGTNTVELNGDGNSSNCVVQNNIFRLAAPNGATSYFDSSTLYITGNGIKITGNTFINASLGSVNGTCAIEVHPGYQCEIIGNQVLNYHTGMNIAGVYETDSRDIIITDNPLEVLRRGIAIYSATYTTHLTGYGIDGLEIDDNIIRVHNQTDWAFGTGGGVGCFGIGTPSGISLAVRNINVGPANQVNFDLETVTPNWSGAVPWGVGFGSSSGSIVYENVHIGAMTVTNSPLFGAFIGSGGGNFKDCSIRGLTLINPGSTKKTPLDSDDYRCGIWVQPNDILSTFIVEGVTIIDNLATSRLRDGICLQCPGGPSGVVSIILDFDVFITGATTTSFLKCLFNIDDQIVPLVRMSSNLGAPTYGAGDVFRIGSTSYDGLNGITYQMLTNEATTFTAQPFDYGVLAVASLPAAAGVAIGSVAFVTDANATTFNSTVAAGGANKVPVNCDGTNWKIG